MIAQAPQALGRYELVALLASGGMAEVYLARARGDGAPRVVAIKRMLPHLGRDPEFVAMFLHEGRVATRLRHPHVCQVDELGEEAGELFLAMEYLDGLSVAELSPLVPRDGALGLRFAAGVLAQACEGLAYAHELRDDHGAATPVVHRDVSPQNLVVTTQGCCKLLDFGVSKVLTEGTRTRTGMLKGKLAYMAPEQIRGESVDVRADVFSMGTVLWELVTGERLFRRATEYQIWRAITEEPVPPVSQRCPQVPAALDAVVERALARTPAERYPTIRAFAQALDAVAAQVGGALSPVELAGLVRSCGGAQLAERARKVAAVQAGLPADDRSLRTQRLVAGPGAGGGGAVAAEDRGAPREAVPAAAVQLAVPVASPPRRRAAVWLAAGALVAAGAGALAVGWLGADEAELAGAASPVLAARAAPARVGAEEPAEPAVLDPELLSDRAEAELAALAGPSGSAADSAVARAGAAPPGQAVVGSGGAAIAPTGASASEPATPPASEPASANIAASAARAGDRAVARAGDRAGEPRRKVRERPSPRGSADGDDPEPGMFSVDSKPYATIYIDGKSHGATPLFKVELPPGKHRVRAVTARGQVQAYTIQIAPGALVSSGTLTW